MKTIKVEIAEKDAVTMLGKLRFLASMSKSREMAGKHATIRRVFAEQTAFYGRVAACFDNALESGKLPDLSPENQRAARGL